jgi:DNA-directed RNA polymerase specialized sigma24 family protein
MVVQTPQSEHKEKIMVTSVLPGLSVSANDPYIDKILEQYDAYILVLARKMVPRNIVPPEKLHDEIEDLAQTVRIKFWHVLQKRRIINVRPYIHLIVLSEVIDMVRRYHPNFPLPIDEDGELYQGNMIATSSVEMQDPAAVIEQAEALEIITQGTLEALLKLPPRQLYAMICALKDRSDDAQSLIDSLKSCIEDFDEIQWPEEKDKSQSLRASLAIARKKLRRYQL